MGSRSIGKAIFQGIARLLLVIGILAVLPVAWLYFGQHSLIYHPRPYSANYARLAGFQGVEIPYRISCGSQTAYFIPARNGKSRRIWLAFCGNGSLALDWASLFLNYPREDEGFLLIDYPGYGRNAGYATIANTLESAEGAWTALVSNQGLPEEGLSRAVLGHSLGAAAALNFAAHHQVDRIVVVSPFTTLREEAARVFGGLLSRLVRENYDNRASLREILAGNPRVRIALFHGVQDDLIPERMGADLARQFPQIRFFPVTGAGHNDVIQIAQAQIVSSMSGPD